MEPHWTNEAMFWATVVVASITIFATSINYLLLRSQTDPEVIVYTKHDLKRASVITLVIENIGKSVAYNIRFESSEKIPNRAYGWDEIPKDKIQWINSGPLILGIPSLPPGGKREIDLGQYVALESIIGNRAIKVTASYEAKKLLHTQPVNCTAESLIDIKSFTGTLAAQEDSELKKIRETLEKIEKKIS